MVSYPAGLGEGYARLASTSAFVRGWRPASSRVGAFALGGLTIGVS